ncbi:Protein phosphatase 1G [Perkinsus chesapeaki]|uniref:protein-serine/threonine phosphatase n=1 Tax=Perkinsus chesapeaki TaxID=330153 RepID=A0A7J6MLW3_PERCH|nr:Protein phosphatase 1G [Perkinsus chesapeaki]
MASSYEGNRKGSPTSRRGSGDLWLDQLYLDFTLYRNTEEYLTLCACVQAITAMPSSNGVGNGDKKAYGHVLDYIDRLSDYLLPKRIDKSYRRAYSPDVKVVGYLFNTLLTAFTLLPSYLLNGVEYTVSQTVLSQCVNLQKVFKTTCQDIVRAYGNLRANTVPTVRSDLANCLSYFDSVWCRFEMHALEEIEVIHKQACSALREAIQAERDLQDAEEDPAVRSGGYRRLLLGRMLDWLSEVYESLTMDSGGERVIFTPDCLVEAERTLALGKIKTESPPSPILMKISKNLDTAFVNLRKLLRRYGGHMYQLNSHLANNHGLVTVMNRFFEAWMTAVRYLSSHTMKKALLKAFDIVRSVRDEAFEESMRSLDPDFLMKLPNLLLYSEMVDISASLPPTRAVDKQAVPKVACTGLPRILGAEQPVGVDEDCPWKRSVICRHFLGDSHKDKFVVVVDLFGSSTTKELSIVYDHMVRPSVGQGGIGLEDAGCQTSGRKVVEAPPSVAESVGEWDGCEEEEGGEDAEFENKASGLGVGMWVNVAQVRSRLSAVRKLPVVRHAVEDTIGLRSRKLMNKVAELGMLMQRTYPMEWNRFVQAVALYVAKHIVGVLTDREAYRQGKYERALHETFMELDRQMMTEKGKKEVAELDRESQSNGGAVVRLPLNEVKSELLEMMDIDTSDDDEEDSDDENFTGGTNGASAEGEDNGQERRRSSRIAAGSSGDGLKNEQNEETAEGVMFLLQCLLPNLPSDIRKRIKITDDGYMEMTQTTLNDVLGRDSSPEGQGCTAVVCLVDLGDEDHPKIVCANAGDSRCMLVRDGKAYDMSEDHKPSLAIEKERIQLAGGTVENCEGGERVQGDLNLSRSLGDHRYKKNKKLYPECQIISAMPDIRVRHLTKEDTHIILGCDGVWEVHSNEKAARSVIDLEGQLEKGATETSIPQPKVNEIHCITGSKRDEETDKLTKVTAAMCSSSVRESIVPTGPDCDFEGTDNVTFMLVQISPEIREELRPLPADIAEKESSQAPGVPMVFGRGPGTKTACEAAMKVMRGKRKRREGKKKRQGSSHK